MKKSILIGLLFIVVAFCACTNQTKTDRKEEDTLTARPMVKDSILMAYDPALDPWNVEATLAKKFGDTLGIKMYEVTLKPGDSVALHTHPDHTLYVVQGGRVSITTKGAVTQELELPTGAGFVNASTSHWGKNIGKTTVRLLVTDVHRARP